MIVINSLNDQFWDKLLVEGNDTDISVNEFKKSLDSGR